MPIAALGTKPSGVPDGTRMVFGAFGWGVAIPIKAAPGHNKGSIHGAYSTYGHGVLHLCLSDLILLLLSCLIVTEK